MPRRARVATPPPHYFLRRRSFIDRSKPADESFRYIRHATITWPATNTSPLNFTLHRFPSRVALIHEAFELLEIRAVRHLKA